MTALTPSATDTTAGSDVPNVVIPNFTQVAPTSILGMSGGDNMIYGGQKVTVLTVSGQTTTLPGQVSITANLSNGVTIVCTNANTVLSGFSVLADGDGVCTWVYSQ